MVLCRGAAVNKALSAAPRYAEENARVVTTPGRVHAHAAHTASCRHVTGTRGLAQWLKEGFAAGERLSRAKVAAAAAHRGRRKFCEASYEGAMLAKLNVAFDMSPSSPV